MPLTIGQALNELPILSQARIIAGGQGLKHSIHWTHIVDNPEVIPWVREGVLLVTTAFGLKEDPKAISGLIPRLVEKKLAGMLVSIGRYIREVPVEMIQDAERLNFPIFTLPWEVALMDVTQSIHERIINEQYALSEQTFQIHHALTNLVAEGGDLIALANSLAVLLKRAVTIEDASMQVLAHATGCPIDEARRLSIETGQTPPEITAHLLQTGVLDQLKERHDPVHVPPIPELGLLYERVIAPILVSKQLYGYIWIIAADDGLEAIDFLAIERAANVAVLIMSREQAVYEAEQRIKANLLESLMDSDYGDVFALSDTLRKLGLSGGYQIMAIEDLSPSGPRLARLSALVEQRLTQSGVQGSVVEWGHRLVVLLARPQAGQAESLAAYLFQEAARQNLQLAAGISSPGMQSSQIRQCYQEAVDALRVALAQSGELPRLKSFELLGFWNYLLSLPEEIRSRNHYYQLIKDLRDYDKKHETELVKTLEVYLDCHTNAVRAAQRLFVHRNTLSHRLAKLSEQWGLNLGDAELCLNLHLALKELHLQN